jgi:prepilin signal peptidase PulO-like enzyme (type II secretory pathway)
VIWSLSWPAWVQESFTLTLSLSHGQQLGLAFVLGSFAVATWSDLKYMAAQREFLEVWLFLIVAAACYDGWRAYSGEVQGATLTLKWALIAALSLASFKEVGWLFRLARADVAALAAAAGLLPPLLIVLLYACAKAASYGFQPLLLRGRSAYPFMPVVAFASLAVLLLGWWCGAG